MEEMGKFAHLIFPEAPAIHSEMYSCLTYILLLFWHGKFIFFPDGEKKKFVQKAGGPNLLNLALAEGRNLNSLMYSMRKRERMLIMDPLLTREHRVGERNVRKAGRACEEIQGTSIHPEEAGGQTCFKEV